MENNEKMEVGQILPFMKEHFAKMAENGVLIKINAGKSELWEIFMNALPASENGIFRERRVWDCNACRSFFNIMGRVVSIDKSFKMISLWDFKVEDPRWQNVIDALKNYIYEKAAENGILEVFYHYSNKAGIEKNSTIFDGETKTTLLHHFFLQLPDYAVEKSSLQDSKKAIVKDSVSVYRRSLMEISKGAVESVLDLINDNGLYLGEQYKERLELFYEDLKIFEALPQTLAENFLWYTAIKRNQSVTHIRNSAIGTLLVDLSDSEADLEKCVKAYESKTAPENYKRSKPIFTKRMKEEAKKTIIDLGLEKSLGRRFATIDDISVRDVLFADRSVTSRMKDGNDLLDEIFDSIPEATKAVKTKRPEAPFVSIDAFVSDILPNVQNLSIYTETRLASNSVSLIAPAEKDAKPITKWNNNFTWAYSGELADSSMKEIVKKEGGQVEGDLRCSLMWNADSSYYNGNDFDLHCIEIANNGNYEIYYRNKRKMSPRFGMLDIDIMHPERNRPAVENIIYKTRKLMGNGKYLFRIHDYEYRGGDDGFKVEIEFDGIIYTYEYKGSLSTGKYVDIAEVVLKDGEFSINHIMQPTSESELSNWGLPINAFVPVEALMLSPNYWDGERQEGNRHYFFMLQGCQNPGNPFGFFNEFLRNDLRNHRKVFEALSSAMKVKSSDKQLSGLGFSYTRDNHVITKCYINGKPKLMDIGFGHYGRG